MRVKAKKEGGIAIYVWPLTVSALWRLTLNGYTKEAVCEIRQTSFPRAQ